MAGAEHEMGGAHLAEAVVAGREQQLFGAAPQECHAVHVIAVCCELTHQFLAFDVVHMQSIEITAANKLYGTTSRGVSTTCNSGGIAKQYQHCPERT